MVDYEARLSAAGLFNVLFLDVVDLDFILATALGIVGGQSAGFFKSTVRQFGRAFSFDDHVGTWHVLGMEPPVSAVGKLEG